MVGIEPNEPEDAAADELFDDPGEGEPSKEEADTGRFDAWRRRSAIGGIATGVALGLQDVFYPTKNEPVISAEAPGEPPDADDRLRVVLDPDDPTKSVVFVPKSQEPPQNSGPPTTPGD